LGDSNAVDKILPVHTAAFFKSEAATMQPGKDGPKPRAQASHLQIRRIVRAALVWCHEQGWTKTVALPATEKGFLEGRKGRRAKAAGSGEPAATTEPAAPTEPTATANPEPVKAAAPRPAITLADEPTNE
jgi:hypothetical protein